MFLKVIFILGPKLDIFFSFYHSCALDTRAVQQEFFVQYYLEQHCELSLIVRNYFYMNLKSY